MNPESQKITPDSSPNPDSGPSPKNDGTSPTSVLTPADQPVSASLGLGKLIAFAVIVLLFVLAAAEFGLRLTGFQFVPPSDFALFTHSNDIFGRCIAFDPDTLYRLKPDSEIDFYSHAYQINSQGWRSAEFTPQKPPKTRRIVAIGDSNVLGYRLTPDQTFTGILGRLAGEKAAHDGLPFEIEAINCGVLGWSSFQVRQALEHRVFQYEPDVLIVNVGAWNEGLWAAHTDREQWAMIHKVNPRGLLYQSRLVQLMRMPVVKRFRDQHINELITIINDSNAGKVNPDWRRRVSFEEFGEDVEWIYRECRRRGIQVIFLSPILRPSMEAAQEPLNEYRGRLAALNPEPPHVVIDMAALTQSMPENDVFLDMDPVHFRPEIHELIAREAFKPIAPVMERWKAE